MHLQRHITIRTAKELADLYYETVRVRSNTPVSFSILVSKLKVLDNPEGAFSLERE